MSADREKDKNDNKKKYKITEVIRRMLQNMKEKDGKQFGRIAVYTVAATAYPLFAVLLPKLAIGILEQGTGDTAIRLIVSMAGYFVLAAVVGYVMNYFMYVIQSHNMRIRLHYVGESTKRLMTMDYKYVEDAGFWEENDRALSVGNNNVEGIEGVYNKLFTIPAQLFSMLVMIVLAGTLNPLVLVALVLHVAVTMWASRQSHNYRYSKKEERAKASRKISYYYKTTHDFSYGKDIRIYNFRERIMENYKQEIQAVTALVAKLAKREYLLGLAGIGTLFITNALMYGILIYRVCTGMPVSSFTMYVTLITTLMNAMLTLGKDITFIMNEGQYIGDFYRLMDEALEKEGESFPRPEDTLEIVFDHVSFRYPGTERYIFKNLNLTIHKGERLAIVGVNGAGKSTLVKLMTGLFEPTEGHIYINGKDITRYNKEDLYALFSAVFQDVNILAFPIRENVACASDNVDDVRVKEALDKVGLLSKVEGFEKGLDQMMLKVIDDEGTDFSGGERQKLSIARGLYKDAPMVIMDEPTAALDALAEAEIYESFSSMVEGKTAVYISHRLASTKFCDKVALFDKDGLKEYGSHDELMELQGSYYEMFKVQGKYYQQETNTDLDVCESAVCAQKEA